MQHAFLLSERVRYAHIAADTAVFTRVTNQADVHLPGVRLGSVHAQADLTPYAAAFDAGRSDGRAVGTARRLSIEFVLIGQAPVPVPLFVQAAVAGADP